MKVTEAMVERAAQWTMGSRHMARSALEAALADVPESIDAPAIEALIDVQAERIAELEAKLDKVRALMARSPKVCLNIDLADILDGEP